MKTLITNYFSRLFFSDENDSFVILVCMDFSSVFDDEKILEYLNSIVESYPILKQLPVQSSNLLYFEEKKNFDLSKQYEIVEKEETQFDSELLKELNSPFQTELPWTFFWYQDKQLKKQRLLLKIHHGYADGYKLIEMVTSPFQKEKMYDKFKRKTTLLDSLYYCIVGTLSLFFMNLNFLFRVLVSPKKTVSVGIPNELLHCKPFPLESIKKRTKEKHITINDFFYTVLLRADYLYHDIRRDILTVSPMNLSQKEATNNLVPIFITTKNSDEPTFSLQNVHSLFNTIKYSFFIPFFHGLLKVLFSVLPFTLMSFLYNSILEQSDYVFTNMMGPSRNSLFPETEKIKFVIKAKDNEIVYNILSYEGVVNICLTFKEGTIQDKERFEQCIYKAYEELIS